ncbi:MAG: leucine-rich repeat protein [Acetatifactor sp.]|nr:leucine-rich repeat protein [Acetatifactor sp.]
MRMGKRFVGCLIMLLVLGLCSSNVQAKKNEGSGKCGENVTWTVDNSGLLTISGQGAMNDNDYGWKNLDVYRVVVEEGITHIGNNAFSSNAIKSVTLPSTLESIGINAFSWCVASVIELPDGLKTIDRGAFFHSGIKEIDIPNSVAEIGQGAFKECNVLAKITLPDNLKSIPKNCFYNCWELKTITIPASVKIIEEEAFYGCHALDGVILPEGLEKIENSGFAYTGLTSISFPSTLTSVGNSCFSSTKIKSVVVPETLTDIGTELFLFAPITSASLPGNMTKIPGGMFDNTSLERIYIPSGVQTIETSAFRWCPLKSIYIPLSVTRIEWNAFNSIGRNMKDIFYEGSEADWEAIGIGDSNYNLDVATIHYNSIGGLLDPNNAKPIQFHVGMADGDKQELDLTIPWDPELFLMSSTQYHNELAIPCLALSGAVELNASRALEMMKAFDFEEEHLHASYFNTEYNYLKPAAVFGYRQVELQGETKNLFVIVIRGTTTGSDVLTDLSAAVGGFGKAAEDVKMRFMEFLEFELGFSYEEAVAKSENNIVLITGHSLGGAIANHLSVDLMGLAPKEKTFVYTFAAPQSFPLNDLQYLTSMTNVFNIVNIKDKVPYMPPLGFYRIGNNIYFTPDNQNVRYYFQRLTQGKTYKEAYDSDWGWFLAPHAIETYMAYLMWNDKGALLDQSFTSVKVVGVHCPVDVEIYDADGALVGRIKDNQIDGSVSAEVGLYVDGDEKYIVLMEDKEYSFVLTGTDAGTMTYEIQTVNMEKAEVTKEAAFSNVELTKGKTIVSEVSMAPKQEVQLFAVNENKERIAEIRPSGEEISLIEEEETTEESSEESTESISSEETVEETKSKKEERKREADEEDDEDSVGDKEDSGMQTWLKMLIVIVPCVIVLIIIIAIVASRAKKKKSKE